jgi:lipoyl(octanoyl) transferase
MDTSRHIEVVRVPGFADYREMLDRQHEQRQAVKEGRAPNTLFVLQHAAVITQGRNAHAEHVVASQEQLHTMGVDLCETDRGGDVTYHGPGQLVAYPILDLNHWRCSVGWYLRALEEVLIRVLATYGLQGERLDGFTGVWVQHAKVAAIGIGVHHWTPFHGIALNIAPDMEHFRLIVPCGIADKPVTSLTQLLGHTPDFDEVRERFVQEFLDYFSSCAV